MTNRVLDLAEEGARLTAKGGLLDPNQIKSMVDKSGAGDGRVNPEQFKKLLTDFMSKSEKGEKSVLDPLKKPPDRVDDKIEKKKLEKINNLSRIERHTQRTNR